jgi:hypothetical protein
MDDLGLALPLRARRRFPAPSDFSGGPFHNRPTRNSETIPMVLCCSRSVKLIPAIHRMPVKHIWINSLTMHRRAVCRGGEACPEKRLSSSFAAVFLTLFAPYARVLPGGIFERMQELFGKALAFMAATRVRCAAALSALLVFARNAWHSAERRLAEASPKLAVRARWLRGRAMRLPRPAVRLMAASTAVVLTLIALAIPGRDDGRILASVELALGSRGGAAAGAAPDEILIAPPPPTAAAVGGAESSPSGSASTQQQAGAQPQQAEEPEPAEEPNLAGLAEIPPELLAKQPKRKGDAAPRKASFAAFSETRENLPWKAVEPVVFTPMGPGQQQKAGAAAEQTTGSPAASTITSAEIGKWMKGKATKIMGAERTKPLYHFVVWVEPPTAMQAHVAGVSYDFSSPAVQPQSQASADRESGFKINAAGLVCADEITVTLRFDDGRVETTQIDGCELFNKA